MANVWQPKRYRNVKARQTAYWQALMCTTYDLCCYKHKDMMHAENCPIATAEREQTKREIVLVKADHQVPCETLARYQMQSHFKANERKFWLGVPCWQRGGL